MRLSKHVWSVHPLRAAAEAVGLECALLLLLMLGAPPNPLLGFNVGWIGIFGALWCALRSRLPEGSLVSVLVREGGFTLLICALLQTAALLIAGKLLSDLAASTGAPLITVLGIALIYATVFFPVRLFGHFWRLWNAIRQRRLLWSIVHAYLLAALVVAALVILNESIKVMMPPPAVQLPADLPAIPRVVFGVFTALTPILVFSIAVVPFVVAVMALAGGVVFYFAARQITRRIEALATTASRLRAGNFQARVAVEGEDEIAQLQTDFNAMAADLEFTLSALKTERDTVSGLLQTRRELIAGVSHELRTPVATMRGTLESALANWQDAPPETLRHDLEVMGREIARLQTLLDDLFTLSRAEVGHLTLRCVPTDVSALIRRVVDTTAPLAWQRRRVRVVANVPAGLPLASADAGRLEQVLLNLIHNSLRHTPPGGIVVVAAREGADHSAMCIEVRDTGEGIPSEDLPHIWERFHRGSQSDDYGENAGLGLALVKELTVAMGGSVDVTSVVGEGSCFTIRLAAGGT
jgi:signal transduction histidine kinase